MASATYGDKPTQTDQHEIVLDGIPYPVQGPLHRDPLTRFQNKTTTGDYSEDSDPLQSAAIFASFTGGIGNEELKEGQDDETYWTGTLETRYPGQITLLPQTRVFDGPVEGVALAYPLADFPADAPSFWAAFDTTICRWDRVNEAFIQHGSISAPPVNEGVEYYNSLYIPLGPAGYAEINADTGAITEDTTIAARSFCRWDNKLAVLTDDGYLRVRFEDTAWEPASDDLKLPKGVVPRSLVVFKNSRGEPTIHIVTSEGVWSYDRDNAFLYSTELQFPRHPDQGRAAINWRGESMYVSVGLGIHSYNGSIVAGMGPDARYGLPASLRGVITGLEPEYNSILALVKGFSESVPGEQEYTITETAYLDEFQPWAEMRAKSTLLRFSGYGWHPAWESPDVGGDPTWPHVSVADGQYWLWWGFDGQMHRQKLPHTFHNPKQGLLAGANTFEEEGSLITGWFDADMPAFRKLGSHMEIVLEDALGNGTLTGSATLYYQIDDDPSWKVLGTTERIGRTIMPFRIEEAEGSTAFSRGLPFTRIRFRLELQRPEDQPMWSPVVRVFLLKFIKLPMSLAGEGFTFQVPLTHDEYKGNGPDELMQRLVEMTHTDRFVEMLHGHESFRVRISQVRITDMTGYDLRAMVDVSAVEIPVPQDNWLPLPGEDAS